MRGTRLAISLVLMLAVAVSGSAPSGYAASGKSFTLRSGKAVFWNGPVVKDSSTPPPGAETCGGVPCWNYTLKVVDRAYRLRVGIDHPEVSDVFSVRLTSPKGFVETFSPGTGLYSTETLQLAPEKGLWRIQVTADNVTDSNFRMRAKLEASRPRIGRGKVLPNLQVLPPHDASFLFPATNGTTDPSRGIDVAGAESCHPEEHVEEQAVRCLRFAFGIRNTGLGPMGLNGDGHYVIRMWADPVGGVLESNEVDNAGYTFFKVTGDEVKLIEAGRGSDPWDRCKILMPFGGHREPRQGPRPKDCRPDTT